MELTRRQLFVLDPDSREQQRQRRNEQEDQGEAKTNLVKHDHAVEGVRRRRSFCPKQNGGHRGARKSGKRDAAGDPALRRAHKRVEQHHDYGRNANEEFGRD